MSATPADDFSVYRRAREPLSDELRKRAHRDACAVTVLAMLDAVAGVQGATTDAVRAVLRECPELTSVALEDVDARDAHAIVVGLAHAGLLDPEAARLAHCRIDLRSSPSGQRPIR